MYCDKADVDVLLFYEHKDRELEVVIEIAKILKYDYCLSVAIASVLYDRMLVPFLIRPKVIVFHSYGELIPIIYSAYRDNVIYVNFNWEQVLSSFNKKYKRPRGQVARSILRHCAWGEKFKDFLIESGVEKENIYVTGKPSITLLKKKALEYQAGRDLLSKRFGIDKNKRWLFFPMTCLHAFFDDYHVKSFINKEIDEQTAFARREYVNKTLNKIFKWIVSLEKECKDKDFIIILRPHPAVSIEQYTERFKKIIDHIPSFIYLSKDLTAHEWLVASDECYTNYSSLVLDAYYINKPAFLMEPEPFPDFLISEWFNEFVRLKTFGDFNLSITQINNKMIEKNKVIDGQFNLGLDGIEETAKLLAGFSKERAQFSSPSLFRFLSAIAVNSPMQYIGSLVRLLATKLKMSKFVRKGIVSDFVDSRDIKLLLKKHI